MSKKVIEMITAQIQDNKDNLIIGEIGKALIMLCEDDFIEEIIEQDLSLEEMSLKHCYDKFYEYASKHKNGKCFAGSSELAEQLIRDFYKIGKTNNSQQAKSSPAKISLVDFM